MTNIAIVAIIISQIKYSTGNSIKKLSVVNTDEYGNDDFSIIKAAEESLIEEFHVKNIGQISKDIRMNIVKRDKIEDANRSANDICTEFLLNEAFAQFFAE